jgi:hypothetical protein
MLELYLDTWDDLIPEIRKITDISVITLRSFSKIRFIDSNYGLIEFNAYRLAQQNHTDRTKESDMWNAHGHDYDHHSSSKSPEEIIYAFYVNIELDPYEVDVSQGDGTSKWQPISLTDELTENDAVLVYHPARLQRVAPNEWWFNTNPINAAIALISLK